MQERKQLIPKGATSTKKLAQPCVTPESTSIPQQRFLPVKTLAGSENPERILKINYSCSTYESTQLLFMYDNLIEMTGN